MSLDNATRLVKVACLLHNFVRMHEMQAINSDQADESAIPQLPSSMRNLDGVRGGVSRSAKDVQAHFSDFLCLMLAVCLGRYAAFTESDLKCLSACSEYVTPENTYTVILDITHLSFVFF